MKRHAALLLRAIALLIPSAVLAEGGWSWQKPQANVAPNGDQSGTRLEVPFTWHRGRIVGQ